MRAGYVGRASAWLYRARVVARVTDDEEWKLRSRLRTAILLLQLGRIGRARKVLVRVARRAPKVGQAEWAGKARHDLLLSFATDPAGYSRAHAHLEQALAIYPVRNPRIPYLLHDFGVILIRAGAYRQALRLLEAVYPHIPPSNRIIIHATIARAYAGVRDHDGFARGAALVEAAAVRSQESASFALVHLAEGARLLAEWDRAERYAAAGLEIALARREFDVVRVAYDVIDAVTTRTQLTIRTAPEAHVRNAVERCLKRLSKLDVPSAKRRSAMFPATQIVSTSWVP
jgi:tetratricopeptide (TPR) repeat protein